MNQFIPVDKRNVQVSTDEGFVEIIEVAQESSRTFNFKVREPELRIIKEIIVTYEDSNHNAVSQESLKLTAKNSNNYTDFTYTFYNISSNMRITVNTVLITDARYTVTLVQGSDYMIESDNDEVIQGESVTITVTPRGGFGTPIDESVVTHIKVNETTYPMDGAAGEKSMLVRDINSDITVSATVGRKKFRVSILETSFCKVDSFSYLGEYIDVNAGENLTINIVPDRDTEFVGAYVNDVEVNVVNNKFVISNIQEDKAIRIIYKQKPYIVFTESPEVIFIMYVEEGGRETSHHIIQNVVYPFTSGSNIRVEIYCEEDFGIRTSHLSSDDWYISRDKIKWKDQQINKNVFIFNNVIKSFLFRTEAVPIE
jgi:hypothetical protein